jgi:single-strand DNA-binding protein
MAFIGQLTGNLGRDPELRTLEINGQPRVVADFSLAVRQPRRQGSEQPARWVKCTAWGRTAEIITDILCKGDKVFLVGRVEAPELFTRRDGQQGLAEKFTVEAFEKMGESGQQQGQQQPGAAPAAAAAPAQPAAANGGYDLTRAYSPAEIAAAAAPPQQQQPQGQRALQPAPVWNSQAPAGGYDDPPF